MVSTLKLYPLVCLLAVLALDKAINYTSVYEYQTAGCVSGGTCCNSNASTTLLAANTTSYTALHLEVPKNYRHDLIITLIQFWQICQAPLAVLMASTSKVKHA